MQHPWGVEQNFDSGIVQLTKIVVARDVCDWVVRALRQHEADVASGVRFDDEGAEQYFVGNEVGGNNGQALFELLDYT